jgi:Zn-dependent peptidase ImmA (M78 family)/DNA-binding XRE family transcriptional regulator
MFNSSRLGIARKRRKFTKMRLAEAVGVTPHTILRYESSKMMPSNDVVTRLAKALEFPVGFFLAPEIDEAMEGAASFRSMAAMTAAERDSALAASTIAFLFTDWVEDRFNLPPPDLIDLDGEHPEIAARSLRQIWGLGERPVRNMVHLLEAKGIRVFALAENTKTVDAFSLWRGGQPFVFLNTLKTPERSRLDAAHELGHLVLHKHGGPKGRAEEHEANRFASSFLMPSDDVSAVAPRVNSLHQIVQLKKRWDVSALALIVRLHQLGVITDWQYRTFCIQASERGMREREENGIDREQSAVWQKVLTALWRERITKQHIAEQLFIPPLEIENLLFGLTGSQRAIDGKPQTSAGLTAIS